MQQELWLRAKSQVLSSIKPLRALRAASASAAAISHSSPSPPPAGSPRPRARAADHRSTTARATAMSHGSSFPSNSHHAPTYPLPSAPRTPNLGHRGRALNNAHHNRGNGVKAEFKRSSSADSPSSQGNPIKGSRTHQELHKELLLAHKKGLGLGLSCKPELQQVLERRRREQDDKEQEEETRSPLEEVLLKRQQKQQEKEKQDEERVREEAHLMEFVRVRQNLKKIHTAFQNKASTS